MKIRSVIIGSALSFAIVFIILFILSVLMYFTPADEGIISAGVYAASAAGVFIGALFAAKSCDSKILINAMSVSLIFIVVITALSLLINHKITVNVHFYAMLALTLGAGFLGAVIGK